MGVLVCFFCPLPGDTFACFHRNKWQFFFSCIFLFPPKKFIQVLPLKKQNKHRRIVQQSPSPPICREEEDWLPAQACDLMLKHFRQSPPQIKGCYKKYRGWPRRHGWPFFWGETACQQWLRRFFFLGV